MPAPATASPPRAVPPPYKLQHGTRWEKEKATAGKAAFDFPEDPKSVGPWIIGECVGKGASGRVKVARHSLTGQLAAVKILPLNALLGSHLSMNTRDLKSEKHRNGIDKEIIMMKLMDHPNIIRIFDVYEGEKELFLILEYVEGGELFDYLVNHGKMDPIKGLCYFKQIIYGLSYAHAFSIIHRDLKPENILIHSLNPPRVKIADWGMAAFAPPSTQLETSCGSPHYASPEIINGKRYEGKASDIWSCGVILYALMTGRLPFDDKNVRTLLGKVKSGKYEVPSYVHPDAADLIRRMLVIDVEQRIKMAEILAHPFLQFETPGTTYVPAPSLEELARPLRGTSYIKSDILRSLQVIWGRATDNEMIADLTSPPGEGSLIKALYFLLVKYREKTLEDFGMNMGYFGNNDSANIKHYPAPPPKTRSKTSSVTPASPPKVVQTTPPAIRAARAAPVPPSPPLQTTSGGRQRPASPVGPRSPQPTSTPGKPSSNTVNALDVATPRVRPTSTPAHSSPEVHRNRHRMTMQAPVVVSPVRPRARRANTTVDGLPRDLEAEYEFVQAPVSPRALVGAAGSATGSPVVWPVIEMPSVADPQLQRTIKDIYGRFYDLVERRGVGEGEMSETQQYAQTLIDAQRGSRVGEARGSTAVLGRDDGGDKENKPPAEVTGGTRALGAVGAVGHSKAPAAKEDGAVRIKRLPTLDLQNPKRSTLMALGPASPTALSPGGAVAGTPVGEVRGWFANLFNWKAQQYVLHSADNCLATRDECARLLERFGVAAVLDDAQGWGTLRCRVDETYDVTTGAVVQKPVRFRVEFNPVLGYIQASTPRLGPGSAGVGGASGTAVASTLVLVQEKGALSTFRAIYQRLRAEWPLSELQAPDVGGATPMVVPVPRLAR